MSLSSAFPSPTDILEHYYQKANIEQCIRIATDSMWDIEITYTNYSGVSSVRRITNVRFSNNFSSNKILDAHIIAYCHIRNEERTFKISRIKSIGFVENTTWKDKLKGRLAQKRSVEDTER